MNSAIIIMVIIFQTLVHVVMFFNLQAECEELREELRRLQKYGKL